jgi:hypothetical protein
MAKRPNPEQFQPAIDRLKAIVAESGDRLLLADGPPNPDAELLDLCAEALHHLKAAEKAYNERPIHQVTVNTPQWPPEVRQRDEELMAEFYQHAGQARSRMVRAKKLRATTAAGIYAKALCVRASRTGAAEFAMSLAEDLVNNPELRASLWPAEARRAAA